MRAAITGANGFVGAHLAAKLVQRGDHVRAMVRQDSDPASLEGTGAERVHGDVSQPDTLPEALKGAEVVFHLAGIRRATVRDVFMKVNAEGTRNVCEAMLKVGARRLVLAGSLAASGPSSPERPRREEDPFAPEEWYGESKAEAERIAFSYAGKLEVAVSRPPRIIGPGDKENLAFFKLVKRGLKLVLSGGPRPLSMVDVDDVVDHMLLLADKREAVGEAFFAASEETTTLEDMQQVIVDHFGWKVRTLKLSPFAFTALANAADVVSNTTGRHLPLNKKLARQLLAPAWTCSIEKSKRLLGYHPKVSIEASIVRSADWYRLKGLI